MELPRRIKLALLAAFVTLCTCPIVSTNHDEVHAAAAPCTQTESELVRSYANKTQAQQTEALASTSFSGPCLACVQANIQTPANVGLKCLSVDQSHSNYNGAITSDENGQHTDNHDYTNHNHDHHSDNRNYDDHAHDHHSDNHNYDNYAHGHHSDNHNYDNHNHGHHTDNHDYSSGNDDDDDDSNDNDHKEGPSSQMCQELESSDTSMCQDPIGHPSGAQLAQRVLCANSKLCACLKDGEQTNVTKQKTVTCRCHAEYMTWWMQNVEATESDGKGFWGSCAAGILRPMLMQESVPTDCDRSLPCPADLETGAILANDVGLPVDIRHGRVFVGNEDKKLLRGETGHADCSPCGTIVSVDPKIGGQVEFKLEGQNVTDTFANPSTCDANKPRLAFNQMDAAKAGRLYKAALRQVRTKVIAQDLFNEPHPRVVTSQGVKFARLPMGQCFGAFREEIHNLADCHTAATYLQDKLLLDFNGTVQPITTDDDSEKPSRCYVELASGSVFFNSRESAHDAEDGKYEKICGDFVEAAEMGSMMDYSASQSATAFLHTGHIFARDVDELQIGFNTNYWFISADGSLQRGPYQFSCGVPSVEGRCQPNSQRSDEFSGSYLIGTEMFDGRTVYLFEQGWLAKHGIGQETGWGQRWQNGFSEQVGDIAAGLWTGDENPFDLCMAVSPKLKLRKFGVPHRNFLEVYKECGDECASLATHPTRRPFCGNPHAESCPAVQWSAQRWCKGGSLQGEEFAANDIGLNVRINRAGNVDAHGQWLNVTWKNRPSVDGLEQFQFLHKHVASVEAELGGTVSLSDGFEFENPFKHGSCPEHTWPNMPGHSFILKKQLKHGTACKRPTHSAYRDGGWQDWESDPTMMTMKADFDDDGVNDYAWCKTDPNDSSRCSTELRGTRQSSNGCNQEENTPWIVENAPALFVKPGDCICSCSKPRCYGGGTNALLQAVSYEDQHSQQKRVPCKLSLPGRKKLESCCQHKIQMYKTVLTEKCGIESWAVARWCENVPDGMEVQIGGHPASSSQVFLHQSANACAESKWRAALVWTKEMDDDASTNQGATSDDLISLLNVEARTSTAAGWDCF